MKLEIELPTESAPTHYKSGADLAGLDVAELLGSGIKSAKEGNRSDARRRLLRATEIEPENETAWLWLASISEYPEELLVFLDKILKFQPAHARALEWKQATKTMLAETFVQRGIAAAEENQTNLAAQCFSQALTHDDRNQEAWFRLAAQADEAEEKRAHLRKVLSINPDHEAARVSLESLQKDQSQSLLKQANFAAISGEREKARRLLDEAVAANADSEEAWMLQAYLADANEEKIAAYEKILSINPGNEAASAGLDSLRDLMQKTASLNSVEALFANDNENQPENSNQEHYAGQFALNVPETPASFDNADVTAFAESLDNSEYDAAEISSDSLNAVQIPDSSFSGNNFMENNSMPENQTYSETNLSNFTADSKSYDFNQPSVFESVPDFDSIPKPESASPFNNEMPESFQQNDETFSPPAPVQMKADVAEAANSNSASPSGAASAIINEAAQPANTANACPFCYATNSPQAFVCHSCRTMLSLSDLEMLLAHAEAQPEVLEMAIEDLEAEKSARGLTAEELQNLGLAYLNLKNLRKGLNCLQEAAQMKPNDIVLASKVNFLAIRLAEIEIHESKIENSPVKNLTILVVDDSATVRKLISSKLEKSGHTVVCAADGGEALDRIKEAVPDLVLLDIMMPQMDGYQVCKLIRANEQTKDVPVVMISGKDGFFDKVRGKMAGTTGYITKPFGPETLMKTIETYIA